MVFSEFSRNEQPTTIADRCILNRDTEVAGEFITGCYGPRTYPGSGLELDAIARGKIETPDMVPPQADIGDRHMHHEIVGPFTHVVVLQNEGERAELHFGQSLG